MVVDGDILGRAVGVGTTGGGLNTDGVRLASHHKHISVGVFLKLSGTAYHFGLGSRVALR